MPIQINIDKPHRLVTSRCSGELHDEDLLGVRQRFKTDPDFNPAFSRIIDMTNVTAIEMSDTMLNEWASDPMIDSNARRALVCTKPEVMTSMLDYIARARRHSIDVSVFPDYDAAKRWIDHREDLNA